MSEQMHPAWRDQESDVTDEREAMISYPATSRAWDWERVTVISTDRLARLRAIEAAARALTEPLFINPFQDHECVYCGEEYAYTLHDHAHDCPWAALRAALTTAEQER